MIKRILETNTQGQPVNQEGEIFKASVRVESYCAACGYGQIDSASFPAGKVNGEGVQRLYEDYAERLQAAGDSVIARHQEAHAAYHAEHAPDKPSMLHSAAM